LAWGLELAPPSSANLAAATKPKWLLVYRIITCAPAVAIWPERPGGTGRSSESRMASRVLGAARPTGTPAEHSAVSQG